MVAFPDFHHAEDDALDGDFEIISAGSVLHLKIAGSFSMSSYSTLAAALDRQVQQYGKVCVLVEIRECDGWRAIAIWQEDNLDFKAQAVDSARLAEAKAWLKNRTAATDFIKR